MANRRMISSDMFEDENFITFDDVTRLVWVGLIAKCADDQGRLQDNVLLIKSQLFPADRKTSSKIEQSIEVLAKSGMLTRYTKDDKNLIQINNWWRHQTPSWASASIYPAPDNWVDKVKYHSKGKSIVSENWTQPGGYIVEQSCDKQALHSHYVGATLPLPKRKVTGLVGNDGEGDVKYDVNGDVKCEGESSESDEIWLSFSEAFQELTNIKPKPTEPVVAMLTKFEELGVTVYEYRKAIQEMQAGGYTIASMTSPEKWVMNNRTNGNKKAVGYRQTRSISPELDEFLKDAPIFAEDIK